MKMILEPAIGAVMMGKDKEGKEIRLQSVYIQPHFGSETAIVGVVLAKSITCGNKAVDAFILNAAGKTGKISRAARPSEKGVVPFIDKQQKTVATKTPAAGTTADAK